jgi:hypothetical protein
MSARHSRLAARAGGSAVVWILATAVLTVSCATRPPAEPDDLCAIFTEKRGWHKDARRAAERWGVPEAVQLALIHQESSFKAKARPPRRWFLWLIPGPRPSSAYGYGQVLDSTWQLYRLDTGRRWADRDDFGDVTDFIGWYAARSRARTGVAVSDAYSLYLVYHEGPGGYGRGSHLSKEWLLRVARKVEARAERYQGQYAGCRQRLERSRWWPL